MSHSALAPLPRIDGVRFDVANFMLLSGPAQRRARRFMLASVRRMSKRAGAAICQTANAGAVTIGVDQAGFAHVTGIRRCASPWGCPVCTPKIREVRAQEINRATLVHLELGGGVSLVTLTVRHTKRDRLKDLIEVLSESWRAVQQSSAWREVQARYGIFGQIRALEMTFGASGWHPHLHLLFFSDEALTDSATSELRSLMFSSWEFQVRKRLGTTLHSTYGVDVRRCDTAANLGGYLAKVGGSSWSIGQEMSRGDRKRGHKSLTPFEILVEFDATGDMGMLELWHEYEEATLGRSSVRWSRGLRARFGVENISDNEAAADVGTVEAGNAFQISAATWADYLRRGYEWVFLDAVEAWFANGRVGEPGHGLRRLQRPPPVPILR